MPFHQRRRWGITDVEDAAALATDLTERTWTCCTGYRHAGYLYLNDATSENGAQEYAVVREDTARQVESITVSWMSVATVAACIANMTAGTMQVDLGPFNLSRIEPIAAHRRCPHCA